MRVKGNVSFTGVMHVQGDILGDVRSDEDAKATIVVGESGKVTGAIDAPHIVLNGRVCGPVHSSQSIEINAGACLAGDTAYRTIAVHSGGVIEGLLIPTLPADGSIPPQASPTPLTVADSSDDRPRHSARRTGTLAGLAILLILAVIAVMVLREPAAVAPLAADVGLKPSSSMNEPLAAQSPPSGNSVSQPGTEAATATNEAPLPAADSAATNAVATSSVALAPMDLGTVARIQGVNPRKPVDVLSLTSKGPAVLYKKKREDTSGGTRIDVDPGEKTSIAIARDEIIRVAEGRDLMIFYQGKMVPPKTIESGAWISFIPLATKQ